MAKSKMVKTTISISEEAFKLLTKLCELHIRSQSQQIEYLIKEAAKKEKK